ncbi:MAG: hypothetical protein PWQ37_1780 [Candidatus Petromonas sp.]|jgi:hypothetical protein|nr:hypothetical protein [Candidatus Petromonas sp.]
MLEVSETSKNIDKVEIVLYDFNAPIWIDDIEISSYK